MVTGSVYSDSGSESGVSIYEEDYDNDEEEEAKEK